MTSVAAAASARSAVTSSAFATSAKSTSGASASVLPSFAASIQPSARSSGSPAAPTARTNALASRTIGVDSISCVPDHLLRSRNAFRDCEAQAPEMLDEIVVRVLTVHGLLEDRDRLRVHRAPIPACTSSEALVERLGHVAQVQRRHGDHASTL